MSYGRQYAWHTAISMASTVTGGVLFYILRIVFYKNLTPEEYGLFFSVYSFAMVIQPALSFGFDPGLVPQVTQYREEKNPAAIKNVIGSALIVQLAVAGGCALVAFIAAPIIGSFFPQYQALPFLIGVLVLNAMGIVIYKVGQQFFLGMQAMVWRSVADSMRSITCVSVAVLLVGGRFGLRGAALAYLIGVVVAALIQGIGFFTAFPEIARSRFQFRGSLVKQAFSSGKYLSLAFGGIAVFSSLDTVMITIVRENLVEVAAYQVALPTAMIIYGLMTAAGTAFLPMARTLWMRGERELLADGISRIYEAACAVIIIGSVLMAAYSDVLMWFLFGKDPLNAPDAFNVLAIAGIFYFLSYLNLHILAGIGQARAAAAIVAIALISDLVLDPVLIYFLGIRGAAMASLAGYAIATVLALRVIRAEIPVVVPVKTAVVATLLSGGAWIGCHLFRSTGVFIKYETVSAALVSGALFVCVVLVLEVSGCARLHELARVVLPARRRAG